jgi:hypothetical protein
MDKTPAKVGSSISALVESSPSSPVTTVTPLPRIDITLASPFACVDDDEALTLKRFKTKRGLAEQLEQENLSSSPSFSTPIKIPNLFPMSPLNFRPCVAQPTLPQLPIPAPLLPRSPIKSCSSIVSADALSARRSALGDITPGANGLSPTKLSPIKQSPVKMSPGRRALARQTLPVSPVRTLNLKKRWLKEVDQEQRRQTQLPPPQQQQQQRLPAEEEPDTENLAFPIRWSDADESATMLRFRRSPLAWSAVSALVEMAEREASHSSNQPLNLSKSKC